MSSLPSDYTGHPTAQAEALFEAENKRLHRQDSWKVVVLAVYFLLSFGMMVSGVVGSLSMSL